MHSQSQYYFYSNIHLPKKYRILIPRNHNSRQESLSFSKVNREFLSDTAYELTNYHAIQYHSPIHNRVTFPYQIRSMMKKKKTRWKKLGRLIRSQLLPVRRFAHFFSGALTTEMSRLSVTGSPLPFKGIIGRSVFSNGSTRAREN